jgi:pimeloyl-ACP methyl ester carboxylesterase
MFRRSGFMIFGILFLAAGTGWAQVTKIPANAQKGFQWPYYLYVPKTIKSPTVLLVEPNNTGVTDDNPAVHDAAAATQINTFFPRADSLGSPYLVPTFPRPATDWKVYTQALDRDSLTTSLPGLVRIDLQLIAMIDDARARLAAAGTNVGPKVWMVGFSGSGSFTNHFALLHPDRIQAASAGSGGEYATAPVSVWKGKTLRFPVGIADLAQLIGHPFDTAAFRKVPMQIYIGDLQRADAVDYEDGYDPEDAALIKEVFGGPHFHRYPASEAAYNSIGSNCQFVIFPGLGHDLPDWNFIKDFLEYNRTEPFPAPLSKPMLYRLYFPHVASFGQWETEISVTNTTEVPVHGEWQAFRADGSALGQSIPLTLPPFGRKQVVAGSFFKNPQEVAYLTLTSDSGFLDGYTRFSQPGNRASLAAGIGAKAGWFTKMEKDGWTGIAFVNTESKDAAVDLTAWDENGNQVAAKSLKLSQGSKFVGMVDQLFPVDQSRAVYFKFKSDRNVLGFTLSGSADGQMLDGLHCLGKYIK